MTVEPGFFLLGAFIVYCIGFFIYTTWIGPWLDKRRLSKITSENYDHTDMWG